MIKRALKKPLSLFLAMVMMLSLFTCLTVITASAVTVDDETSFLKAIHDASTTQTVIEINENITVTSNSYNSTQVLAVGLKNKNIKFIGSGTVTLSHRMYFSDGCAIEFAGPGFKIASGVNERLIVCWSNTSQTVTFTSGSFDGNIQAQAGTTININGGSFTNTSSYNGSSSDTAIRTTDGYVNIYGGTFSKGTKNNDIQQGNPGTLKVYGGTFEKDPSSYVQSGYKATASGSVWTVDPFSSDQAKIGSTLYATLDAAVAAAEDGDTIELLDNVTGAGNINISGKKLTFTGNYTVTFASGTTGLTCNTGSEIVVDGPTFIQGEASRALCVWQGVCTVKSGGFTGFMQNQGGDGAVLNIEGGTFTQIDGNNLLELQRNTSITNISGGNFVSIGRTAPIDIYEEASGKLTITGGVYSFDPSDYVAEGYSVTKGNGIWYIGVVHNVASAAELATALTNAKDGDTINFTADITDAGSINTNACADILAFTGDYTVTFASGTTGLTANSGSNITVNGPTFVQGGANRALCIWEATVTVEDGGFTGRINPQGGTRDTDKESVLIINGGTFTQLSGSRLFDIQVQSDTDKSTVTVNGGNFIQAGSEATVSKPDNATAKFEVKGGTFNFDPTAYAAPRYDVIKNGDVWTVEAPPPQATVFDVANATELATALTNAIDGDTINFTADIADAGSINTNACADKLTFTGNYTVTFASDTTGLTCNTGSEIVVDGPTFVQGGATRALCVWEGSCTVKSGGFTGLVQNQGGTNSKGVLNIEGGTFTQLDGKNLLDIRWSNLGGTTTVTGGSFVSVGGDTAPIVKAEANCEFFVHGGTYNFDPSAYVDTERYEVTVNGSEWLVSVLGYFSIDTDGTVGSVTQYATVKPNTNYAFTFKLVTSAGTVLPFVKSVAADSLESDLQLSEIRKNTDGSYSYYCEFKTPASLRADDNLRIGFAFTADDVALVANAVLRELDDGMEMTGANLLANGDFTESQVIPEYSAGTPDWFFEGATKSFELTKYAFSVFELPVKKLVFFDGKLGSSAAGGTIRTVATLENGKTYNFSVNLKYAGYDTADKMGLSFEYQNKRGDWTPIVCEFNESTTEHKWTASFTLDASNIAATDNVRLNVKVGSQYVSGYLANAVLTESGSNENLFKNGYFYNSLEDWEFDGVFDTSYINEIPENYFSKTTQSTENMMIFNNSTGWLSFKQYISFKPGAYYKMVSNEISTYENTKKSEGYNAVVLWNTGAGTGCSAVNEGALADVITDTKVIRYYKIPDNFTADNGCQVQLLTTSAENSGYWGGVEIYECDENGNVISGNLVYNGNFEFGIDGWSGGYDFPWRIVEQPDGFFENYTAHDDTMVYSNGTEANAELGQYITVQKGKKYYFSLNYIGMNSVGIIPMVIYTDKNGNKVSIEPTYSFHASATCLYEGEFIIPDDAKSYRGETEVKFVLSNGSKGKAYITRVGVYEEGKYENLLTNPKFTNGFSGWLNGNDKTYSGTNYKVQDYREVFVFHYDDALFEDGDWAGVGDGTVAVTTGAILGTVYGYENKSVQGLTVTLLNTKHSATVDEYGMFAFYDLKPGTYTVCIVGPSGSEIIVAENVTVKKGETARLNKILYMTAEDNEHYASLTVTKNVGIVYGYLFDADGNPWKGQMLYLGAVANQETKDKGIFQFNDVPAGEYDIYTKLEDGTIYILQRVKVTAGENQMLKLSVVSDGTLSVLWIILIAAGGIIVLAGAAVAVLLIVKKKKAR